MNDEEIMERCDMLMSTAEVKYTATHLELAITEARKDTAAQIFKEFEPFVDRNMLIAFEELKKKFGVD